MVANFTFTKMFAPEWHFRLVGVILIVVGIAKFVTISEPASFLTKPDPLLGLSYRGLVLLVGPIEILLGAFCLLGKASQLRFKVLGLAWLASMFVLYRVGMWWIGSNGWCGCFGRPAEILQLSDEMAENLARMILGYFWILIGWTLMRLYATRKERVSLG